MHPVPTWHSKVRRAVRWTTRGALPILLIGLAAAPARADVGPPLKITLQPPPEPDYPQQGLPYQGVLRLTGAENAMVSDFTLTGPRGSGATGQTAWQQLFISIPPGTPTALTANVPLDVTFQALPDDPTEPVVFSFLYNGDRINKQFFLIPRARSLAKAGGPVDQTTVVEPTTGEPPVLPESVRAVPGPVSRDESGKPAKVSAQETAEDTPRDGVINKNYSIRVKGRFVYTRNGGPTVGVDGATVRVMDEDVDWDDELTSFATDPQGYFDVTFTYTQSEDPDIYLEFESANTRIEVEEPDWLEYNYVFTTGVKEDYEGTFIDYGWRTPSDSYYHGALHVLTIGTHTWRWCLGRGYDTPSVDIQWPEAESNSWYDGSEMHINTGKTWREDTISHEYGHHWVENFADDNGDDYCNSPSRCDSPDDCGHCLWCQETGGDAWQEGFPNMIADFVTESLESDYGLASANFRNGEVISTCGEVGMLDDPWKTEGHLGALLRDIIDSAQDDDPSYSQGIDELDLTAAQMFDLVATYEPLTPSAFISTFQSVYPQYKTQFWATCENNGYNQTDTTDPSTVSGLGSPSHSTVGDSPDATIQYTWAAATDNLSGIAGYSVSVTASPTLPNTSMDIGNVTTYTTSNLNAPATYWFNIRTVDRAGNWDAQYATFGPITLRDPYPADLRPDHYEPGWAYGLIPRNTTGSTFTSCPTPTTLPGNIADTYWNVAYLNGGELSSTGTWSNRTYLDGTNIGTRSFSGAVCVGCVAAWVDQGPITVRGGRHMLSTFADYDEAHPEQDEDDNTFQRQWVWTPFDLVTGTLYTRSAPPDPTGGFFTVPFLASSNCDGLQAQKVANAFYAVTAWASNNATDYDLSLYPHSTGATDGFTLSDVIATGAASGRPAGCLDMVMFRYDVAGASIYDAGVLNYDDGTSSYNVVKDFASTITLGTPAAIQIPANRWLAMRQFDPPGSGNYTVSIDIDPAAGPVHMALYDDTFATGDLLDYEAHALTDVNGHAAATLSTVAGGWCCVVVWQDPKDAPAGKAGTAIDVAMNAFLAPPDLTYASPSGWYAPLVARPANDGTFNNVPAPASLTGNANATYMNFAWKNTGLNSTPSTDSQIYVDGVGKILSLLGSVPPGTTSTSNVSFATTVKGGRHTVHVRYDINSEATEGNELNNAYGIQYVWSPLPLGSGVPVNRNAPEAPTAGWADALTGGMTLTAYNCDGLRTPVPVPSGQNGYWQATAAMPGANSDVDVRLHEVVSGALGGFKTIRAQSGWTTGHSDFVLTNFRATAPLRAFDVGVVGAVGTESYTAETVASTFLGTNPAGAYGNFTLGPNHIVNLHEVYLEAGPISIGLYENTGDVDWGFSIHEGGLAYHGKDSGLFNGVAWMNPVGDDEWLIVDVPVAGYYCLAVWKVGTADLAKNGSYRLEFIPTTTDAPAQLALPRITALTSVHPNPFNPRTSVSFDLAQAGSVQLAVYNIRGELVRTLVSDARAAGRHEVTWDGTDNTGQPVASGVYIARLAAGSVQQQRKLMLVK